MMKKFLVMFLCVCMIFGNGSPSLAAKKKAKKSASQQGDKIEQILKRYPERASSINAQFIRSILKITGNDKILAITSESEMDGDSTAYWKLISATNASEKKGFLPYYEIISVLANRPTSIYSCLLYQRRHFIFLRCTG